MFAPVEKPPRLPRRKLTRLSDLENQPEIIITDAEDLPTVVLADVQANPLTEQEREEARQASVF